MRRWWLGLISALLLASVIWGVYFAVDPGRMPIRSVVVEGDFRYLERGRLEAAVAPHLHAGFFGADLRRVRQAALALPWVREVSVRRRWPDGLHIQVRERRAAARWAAGGLVDTEGLVFRPPPQRYPKGLPVLEGPPGSTALLLRRYRELQGWVLGGAAGIRRVVMDPRRAWRVELQAQRTLVLGREPQRSSVERLARLLPALEEAAGMRIEQADLRYPNGFAVRWRRGEDTVDEGS